MKENIKKVLIKFMDQAKCTLLMKMELVLLLLEHFLMDQLRDMQEKYLKMERDMKAFIKEILELGMEYSIIVMEISIQGYGSKINHQDSGAINGNKDSTMKDIGLMENKRAKDMENLIQVKHTMVTGMKESNKAGAI